MVDNLEGWSYPLFPLPPGSLHMLLGDVPVVAFLIFFILRYTALARINERRGANTRAALYARKVRLYKNLLIGSVAFTVGSFLIFLTLLIIPGTIVASPVGGVIGAFGFLPFLVWLVPLVAMVADLLITWKARLR